MVKLTRDELLYMSAFQTFTGVMARDCVIMDDTIVFLVNEDSIGKAIGKEGRNVKNLSLKAKKKIQVLTYSDRADLFVKQAFKENTLEAVDLQEKEVVLTAQVSEKRKLLQNKWKWNLVKGILKRNYDLDNMRIK